MINGNKIFSLILLMAFCVSANGQEEPKFTKNSLRYGMALGVLAAQTAEGTGVIFSVGYQRSMWKGRLRLNPSLSHGTYSTILFSDSEDKFFNTLNLSANIYLDVIRISAFSLVFGCGGEVNSSYGLERSSGRSAKSDFFADFNAGAYLGGGFRINPKDSRTAINIMPLNLRFGKSYYYEYFFSVELEYKF